MHKAFFLITLFFCLSPLKLLAQSSYEDYRLTTGLQSVGLKQKTDGFGFYKSENFGDSSIYSLDTGTSIQGDCARLQGAVGLNIDFGNLNKNIEKMANLKSCREIKNNPSEKFTENNCKLLIACSKSKVEIDELALINNTTIPRLVAEDFVTLKLNTPVSTKKDSQEPTISLMEKIEAVRVFSEKKYGEKFASSCKPIFDYNLKDEKNTTACDVQLFDTGFKNLQNECSVMDRTCYNYAPDQKNSYGTYYNNYKNEDKKSSVAQSFFSSRIDSNVNDSLSNDMEILDYVASVANTNDGINVKLQSLFSKLDQYKRESKLDPVLGYDSDYISASQDQFQKSFHYDFFKKLLSKKSSAKEVKDQFEKYRNSIAKNILDKPCNNIPTVNSICNEATKMENSEAIANPTRFYERSIAATKLENVGDDKRFSYVSTMFPDIKNAEDFKVIIDAFRCSAFQFNDGTPPVGVYDLNKILFAGPNNGQLGGGIAGLSSASLYYKSLGFAEGLFKSTPDTSKVNADKEGGFFSNLVKKVEDKIGGNKPAATETVAKDSKDSQEKVNTESTKSSGLGSSISKAMNDSFKAPADAPNNYTKAPIDNNIVAANVTSVNSSSETVAESSKDSVLNAKIGDLTKKLNAAEKNLDKIKEEKEIASSLKEKKQRTEEENKTIADLKEQINSLSEQKNKAASIESSENVAKSSSNAKPLSSNTVIKTGNSETGTTDEIVSNSRTNAFNAEVAEAAKIAQAANRSSNVTNENSVNGASTISRGPASQNNSASTTGTATGKSAVVLTKIDGMSTEKAIDAINEKIIESNGTPFLIEEGGVVKEVIPARNDDGTIKLDEHKKPIFTKITKGKIGDKKFVELFAPKNSERVPASVVNPADLKQAEEERLKKERAEYLKLKAITNEAINKD